MNDRQISVLTSFFCTIEFSAGTELLARFGKSNFTRRSVFSFLPPIANAKGRRGPLFCSDWRLREKAEIVELKSINFFRR